MNSNAKTVAEYLAALPDDRRNALKKVRTLVRKELAGVKEEMTYGMPSYFWKGYPVVAFASQAHYMSLYVCDTAVLQEYRKKLGKLDCGVGCIRFRKIEDLPLDVAGGRSSRKPASAPFRESSSTRATARASPSQSDPEHPWVA